MLLEGLTCVVMCACSACCGLSKLESISTSLLLLVAVFGTGACTTALWPARMGSTLGEKTGAMPSNDSLSPPVRGGMRDDGVRSAVGDRALAPLLSGWVVGRQRARDIIVVDDATGTRDASKAESATAGEED
jgi:hypothetical protein